MNEIDNALRTMLRERATDITTLPTRFDDLSSLDATTIHVDDGLGAVGAKPRRHHGWLIVAAVASVLLVTGGAIALDQLHGRDNDPAAPTPTVTTTPPAPKPPPHSASQMFAWPFDITPPTGYQLMNRSVTAAFGAASLRLIDDPDAVGCCGSLPRTVFVNVYKPGAYDPSAVLRGTAVRIGTEQGHLATIPAGQFDATTKISNKSYPTLAWQYAPDAWVTVLGETAATQRVEELVRIARAVRTQRPVVLRAPLRLGYLPANLRAVQAVQDLPEIYGTTLDVGDGLPGQETTTALNIKVWSDAGPHQSSSWTAITVGGRSGKLFDDGSVSIAFGGRDVVLGLSGPRASTAELMKTLASVQWAPSVTDTTTWFAGTTLLP